MMSESQPFPMSHADYMDATQGFIEKVMGYRNLAIELGATPDDMLSSYDRGLCSNWSTYHDDDEGWHRDRVRADNLEYWTELEIAVAALRRVRAIPLDMRNTLDCTDAVSQMYDVAGDALEKIHV